MGGVFSKNGNQNPSQAELVPLSDSNTSSSTPRAAYGGRFHAESFHEMDWKEWWELKLNKWVGPDPLILIASVVGLMIATATERVAFKMTVDRMTPFRLTLIVMTFVISALVYGVIAMIKLKYTNKITPRMMEFPHRKLLVMALIDTVSIAGLALSAAAMTPTMTVILLHMSTPFVVRILFYVLPSFLSFLSCF